MYDCYYFLSQGKFTNWINELPLRITRWFESSSNSFVNLTIHILNGRSYTETPKTFNYEFVDKEPDVSIKKNCTGIIPYDHGYQFPWITIPCDVQYVASYICERPRDLKQLSKPVTYNYTCDDEWFMVNGTNNCFTVLWTSSKMSYHDAQDICTVHNSSVLTVGVMEYTNQSHYVDHDDRILRLAKLYGKNKHPFEITHFFGKPLSGQLSHHHLLNMVNYAQFYLYQSLHTLFFVNANNRCSVVERSEHNIGSGPEAEGWGVKCKDCDELAPVSGVICEKPRRLFNTDCLSSFFKCFDGTCILLLYKCDIELDCFDGSDEDNCSGGITYRIHEFVTLPFVLDSEFERKNLNVIPIYSICDGMYSNKTLRQEQAACYQYQLKRMNVLTFNKGYVLDRTKDQSIKSDALFTNISNVCVNSFLMNASRPSSEHAVNFIKPKQCISFNKHCKLNVHQRQCPVWVSDEDCTHFSCPGMFKCDRYRCIYMSAVCDGQYNCKEGDDEMVCPLSSCSGFLKCRGENRCVSKDEICDGYVNCLYSMDDEIGCQQCPSNCECSGYIVSCMVDNSLGGVWTSGINYTKGIILKGSQVQIFVRHLNYKGLVYVNVSFCHIDKISYSHSDSDHQSFIIIADFSTNNINEIAFLQSKLFMNIMYLELSYNRLYFIQCGKYLQLKYLAVLGLKGNPLKEIIMSITEKNLLVMIDIQNIHDYFQLKIKLILSAYKQIFVKVSDTLLCCIIHKDVQCIANEERVFCFGLIHNNINKISFYTISIIVSMGIVILLRKHILHWRSSKRHLNRKKKYYLLLSTNHLFAVTMNVFYILGLVIADVVSVNLFIWRTTYTCMLLNIILYISLECMICFNTGLVIILASQIIYPYRHQLIWLKWVSLFSTIAWLFFLTMYFVNFREPSLSKPPYTYDYLCSIGMIEINEALHILLTLVCFIDNALMVVCIFPLYKAYSELEKSKRMLAMLAGNHKSSVSSFKITIKLSCRMLTEIPFRMALLYLLITSQVSRTVFNLFCKYVFILNLPVNMICISMLLFFRE